MEDEEPLNIYMNNRYSYLEAARGSDTSNFFHSSPVTKKPKQKDINYDMDKFIRYFTKKNTEQNSTIYEIDLNQFNLFKKNPFYICTSVVWQISGNIETVQTETGDILGVRDFNVQQITSASRVIDQISLVLNNPLEFYMEI